MKRHPCKSAAGVSLRKLLRTGLLPLTLLLTVACGAENEKPSAATEPSALAAREDALSYPFVQFCQQPYSQRCNPMWTQTVTTQDGLLRVAYTASPYHCANVFVEVYLDGVLKQTTRSLAASESSGWQDLGPVAPGSHTVGLMAYAVTGGCNTGHIESWGGTLSVTKTSAYSFAQTCLQPYSQTCSPMWTQSVTTGEGPLSVAYLTASTHCSNVTVDIYVDGVLKGTTRVLSPVESSGWFHLGSVTAGSHTVGLVAHGITGGCNIGYLHSWGGTLSVNAAE